MNPTSRNAKETIWRIRFGVLKHFAFSGIYSAACALYVIYGSRDSRIGAFIIASPVRRVVPGVQITAY